MQLCMERTIFLLHACLEKSKNVALIWSDVGMLIIEGKDVKMRFYRDFLRRLNGTGQMFQALLEVGFSFSQGHPWFFWKVSWGLGGCFLPACHALFSPLGSSRCTVQHALCGALPLRACVQRSGFARDTPRGASLRGKRPALMVGGECRLPHSSG